MRQKFISLVLVDHIKRKLGRLLAINFDGKIVLGCFRLGNVDSNFKIRTSDLIAIEREIRKRISTLTYPFLYFHFTVRKRIWKTVLKNRGLARTCIISGKKKTTVYENSFAILFPISQSNCKMEIQKIRIWISQLKFTLRTVFAFDWSIHNRDFKI